MHTYATVQRYSKMSKHMPALGLRTACMACLVWHCLYSDGSPSGQARHRCQVGGSIWRPCVSYDPRWCSWVEWELKPLPGNRTPLTLIEATQATQSDSKRLKATQSDSKGLPCPLPVHEYSWDPYATGHCPSFEDLPKHWVDRSLSAGGTSSPFLFCLWSISIPASRPRNRSGIRRSSEDSHVVAGSTQLHQRESLGRRGSAFCCRRVSRPHPHRGFETVTYVLRGGLVHRDSMGVKTPDGAWRKRGQGSADLLLSEVFCGIPDFQLNLCEFWGSALSGHHPWNAVKEGGRNDPVAVEGLSTQCASFDQDCV